MSQLEAIDSIEKKMIRWYTRRARKLLNHESKNIPVKLTSSLLGSNSCISRAKILRQLILCAAGSNARSCQKKHKDPVSSRSTETIELDRRAVFFIALYVYVCVFLLVHFGGILGCAFVYVVVYKGSIDSCWRKDHKKTDHKKPKLNSF